MDEIYQENAGEVKTISQQKSENPSYWGVSIAKVRYDSRLTNAQKLLHVEFSCLTNKFGYCHASNAYFARLYDVDKRTIQRWIEGLKDYGYVTIQEIKNQYGETIERRIFLVDDTPMTMSYPPMTNLSPPHDINVTHNNTRNNNTSIIPPNPLKGGMPVSLKKKTDNVVWEESSGFTIDEKLMQGWRDTYVAIDVDQKIREIHQYCLANPRWRKKNWSRTINSWLMKANDSAPIKRSNGSISRPNIEVDAYRWFEGLDVSKAKQTLRRICNEKILKDELGELITDRNEWVVEFLSTGGWNALPMYIRKAIIEYKYPDKKSSQALIDHTENIRKNWRELIKSWIKRNNFKREDNPEWVDAIDKPDTTSLDYFKFAHDEYFLLDREEKLSELLSNAG